MATLILLALLAIKFKKKLHNDDIEDQVKKFDKNLQEFIPKNAYDILMLYVCKPILVGFLWWCTGKANSCFHSSYLFFNRLFYDVFIIFMALKKFEGDSKSDSHKDLQNPIQLVALIAPILILEFGLYFCSVKKANIRSRGVYYRMIRTQIKTD